MNSTATFKAPDKWQQELKGVPIPISYSFECSKCGFTMETKNPPHLFACPECAKPSPLQILQRVCDLPENEMMNRKQKAFMETDACKEKLKSGEWEIRPNCEDDDHRKERNW